MDVIFHCFQSCAVLKTVLLIFSDAILTLITLSLVIFRLWHSNKMIIKKNRAGKGKVHWPCPIITNCLDTRAKKKKSLLKLIKRS